MASEWAKACVSEIFVWYAGSHEKSVWANANDIMGDIIDRHADAEMKRLRELCREAATEIMHQPVKWCCRQFSRPKAGHTDNCIVKRLQDAAFKE